METSGAKFLDLKSTMAKGFMHNTQGVHEFASTFYKILAKFSIFFHYKCRQQTTAAYAVPLTHQ